MVVTIINQVKYLFALFDEFEKSSKHKNRVKNALFLRTERKQLRPLLSKKWELSHLNELFATGADVKTVCKCHCGWLVGK